MPSDSPIDVANAKPAAWAASLVTRLKYLQTNLTEATPENRQVQMEEELRRALQELPLEKRGSHLYALAQAFPEWELAAATVVAPAAAARQTPDEIIRSFVQLVPSLSGAQREKVKQELAALGLVLPSPQPLEGEALVGVRAKLKLDAEDPINVTQLAKLFAAYAEAMLALDQLAWNVWRNAAPKSPIRRDIAQGDLRTVTRRALAGDAESAVAQAAVQKQLEASRQLVAGLLAGLGPAGKNFARRYQQRYTPDAVREVVRAEGGKGDLQFWKKHTELAAEVTETVIEDDVQAAVVKYAEDLMRGSQRE
ncbi:MAG TPA: hypothetical protein VGD97_00030 [Lacunisphaera sp.]